MNKRLFARKLINWYTEHQRSLPWRETKDPYRIWLSEIILQQTRVAQGLPYYERFVKQYPTVHQLAAAPQQQVLRLWQGLGYYTRARNLHACAKQVVAQFSGQFPTTYDELLKLPGIGPYTAAAIASISFQQPVAVLDGNVFRVLARVFALDDDITSPATKKKFTALANELISKGAPDLFNQAVMEFGALQCVPRNPDCQVCPLAKNCLAFHQQRVEVLPVKKKKAKVRHRYFTYFIFDFNGKVLMRQRLGKDIWYGLFEYPLVESNSATQQRKQLSVFFEQHAQFAPPVSVGHHQHVLTHQRLHVHLVRVEVHSQQQAQRMISQYGGKFYSPVQVRKLPKPILIATQIQNTQKGSGKI